MKKYNPLIIGLLQAVLVVVYCALIASFFVFADKNISEPKGVWGPAIMLTLLVFSAAVTGSIVFGYPAYLFLKDKQIKAALQILAYTLIFCLAFILIAFIIISVSA